MAQYYTVPTTIGQAKLANAVALGIPIEIVEMAVGDGGGTLPDPDSSRTALINEVRRAQINASETDPDNPSWIVIEQVIPPDIGGWAIREVGVFDADGDMIAYGNYPETYKPVLSEGSGRTQTIRFVMQVSDTAAVTLKVDPSIVLATRRYVDDALDAHEQSRNHPAATTTALGFVEKATVTEAKNGTPDKFPDSAGVIAAMQQFGLGRGVNKSERLNELTAPGFYYSAAPAGASDRPANADENGYVSVVAHGTNSEYILQYFVPYTQNRLFLRRKNGASDWSGWSEFLDTNSTSADAARLGGKLPEEYATAAQGDKADSAVQPDALGTAAGRGVQATPTDTTPGRLMAVGAFGLGGNLRLDGANLNDIRTTGVYGQHANSGAQLSLNYPTTQAGCLFVGDVNGEGILTQHYVTYGGTDGSMRYFFRGSNSDYAWRPWVEVYHTGNLGDALAPVAFGGKYNQLEGLPPLGSAASTESNQYATAAQGEKADSAVQPDALGTAAGRGVQATPTDTTPGCLMAVGAFGLGGNLRLDEANLNDIRTTGVYGQNANSGAELSLNYPTTQAGCLFVGDVNGEGILTQTYVTYGGTDGSMRYFFRGSDSGYAWRPWEEVYHTGNLAEAFSGSLEGDGWQPLPGGFILQWGNATSVNGVSTATNFPIAFPNACLCAVACDNEDGVPHSVGTGWTRTQVQVTTEDDGVVRYMAIGH